jgi:hypothetical protein
MENKDQLKVGDKLRCTNTRTNIYGQSLFIKDEVYNILSIDEDPNGTYLTLDHILIANEYGEFSLNFVNTNFVKI